MSKTTEPPDGMGERTAAWHLEKFIEFTTIKQKIGEPSPHLAIVGHMCRDKPMSSRLWLLGCYGATYCLPTAQVLWTVWDPTTARNSPTVFRKWLVDNWKGIVTRQERRCVRTPDKMGTCLLSYLDWMRDSFPKLVKQNNESKEDFYDRVWGSVEEIKYFGRYINIRVVEGLRRYCGVPASLYDIRSIGGWSPKKCLCYLYPEHAERLLVDDQEGNELTDELAYDLLAKVQKSLPQVDCYILAAMLCEYKGAFEKRHQYPGWTIDQEPLLYDKVIEYWGDRVDVSMLWEARAALFPRQVLGEYWDWNGTRWELAKTLRDHGYNWSDLEYDYAKTEKSNNFSIPIRRQPLRPRRVTART